MTDIAIPDGFTRWDGENRYPDGVNEDTVVAALYEDGVIQTHTFEHHFYFRHSKFSKRTNIIAYRIVP